MKSVTINELSFFDDMIVPDKGLVIRQPWADMIVTGEKQWEIRGFRSHFRGPIAIIAGGTGTILGTCELVNCIGPLTLECYNSHSRLRGSPDEVVDRLPYKNTYAWHIAKARQFSVSVPYVHPMGAVIWVTLSPEMRAQVVRQCIAENTPRGTRCNAEG